MKQPCCNNACAHGVRGMIPRTRPSAPRAQVMRDSKGALHLIRAKQTLEQITANERPLPASAAL